MPWYVVEEDEEVTKTNYYFVKAADKAAAIDKTLDIEPVRTKTFDGSGLSYKDTHVASFEEHRLYGDS